MRTGPETHHKAMGWAYKTWEVFWGPCPVRNKGQLLTSVQITQMALENVLRWPHNGIHVQLS